MVNFLIFAYLLCSFCTLCFFLAWNKKNADTAIKFDDIFADGIIIWALFWPLTWFCLAVFHAIVHLYKFVISKKIDQKFHATVNSFVDLLYPFAQKSKKFFGDTTQGQNNGHP